MACESTTSNSNNTREAASFPTLGWSWKTSLAWLDGIALWLEERHQYKELLELDERLLADIGVSKTAAIEARRSHLYMIAWRDSR
jgi:uncharacterized protein YjiS (DUF1127 family)